VCGLCGERHGPRSRERLTEPREHGQVGVKRDPLQASDAESSRHTRWRCAAEPPDLVLLSEMKRLGDPYRDLDVIDKRGPRFNQATVGLVSVLALATGWWWLLAILAAQLAIGLVFGRQYCLPCLFYFEVVQRIFGEGPLEDARPPKFANIVGAVFLTTATVAYWLGAETVGFVLGAIVAALALLAAATGFCAGCEAFKLGSFVLRRPFVSCPIPGGSAPLSSQERK